jgi:hypothetical protein
VLDVLLVRTDREAPSTDADWFRFPVLSSVITPSKTASPFVPLHLTRALAVLDPIVGIPVPAGVAHEPSPHQ